MAGDSNYPSVSLLLHCDGANTSTVFTDSSLAPKIVTANGNAQISTAQSAFGGASALLDGAGDYLSVSDAPDLRADGDFTAEAWIRPASVSGLHAILVKRSASTTIEYQRLLNGNKLYLDVQHTGGVLSLTGTTSLSANAAYHVAAVRSGTTWKIFVDGVQNGSGSVSGTYIATTDPVLIGRASSAPAWDFNGYIDEVRITKGVARYTGGFTPPAAAHPDFSGQVAGVIRDDTNAPCARTVRLIRRDTGAQAGTVVSNASTGAYSINCPTLDEVCRIVHDDAAGTLYNDLIDRVIPA